LRHFDIIPPRDRQTHRQTDTSNTVANTGLSKNVVDVFCQAKLRLEMGQERLRQQHAKELEEKELDMETIKASTQKKVGFFSSALIPDHSPCC